MRTRQAVACTPYRPTPFCACRFCQVRPIRKCASVANCARSSKPAVTRGLVASGTSRRQGSPAQIKSVDGSSRQGLSVPSRIPPRRLLKNMVAAKNETSDRWGAGNRAIWRPSTMGPYVPFLGSLPLSLARILEPICPSSSRWNSNWCSHVQGKETFLGAPKRG